MLPSIQRTFQPSVPPDERDDTGLQAMLRGIFPLESPDGGVSLQYVSYQLHPGQLRATFRLVVWDTGPPRQVRAIHEQPVLLAELPDLTQERPLRLTRAPGLHRPAPGVVEIQPLIGSTIRLERRKQAITARLGSSRHIPAPVLCAALGIPTGGPAPDRDAALCALAAAHSRKEMSFQEAAAHLTDHFFSLDGFDLSLRGRIDLLQRLGVDVPIEQHGLAVPDIAAALQLLQDDPDSADEPGDLGRWRAADTGAQLVDALRDALRKARPTLTRRLAANVLPSMVFARLALWKCLVRGAGTGSGGIVVEGDLGGPHPSWRGRLTSSDGALHLAEGATVNVFGLIEPSL